jgi:hypothetical protein
MSAVEGAFLLALPLDLPNDGGFSPSITLLSEQNYYK